MTVQIELVSRSSLSHLTDDAHGGLLGVLAQGVVLEDAGVELFVQTLVRHAENLALQVVDVHDGHAIAQSGGDIPRHLIGLQGAKHHILVVGRDGVVAGAVDGAGAIAGHGVEPALFMKNFFADHRAEGREQNPQRAALPQGIFHGFGHPEANAVGRLGDVGAELVGKLPGLDVLEGNGPLLGAGHALFRDKKNIIRLGQHGLAVLFGHVHDIVLVGDQVGFDGQALIFDSVYLNDILFALVGGQCLFHSVYLLPAAWGSFIYKNQAKLPVLHTIVPAF